MIWFALGFLLLVLPFGIAGTDIKFASQLSALMLMGILIYTGKAVWAVLHSWMFWVVLGIAVVGFLYWVFFLLDDQIK